MENQQIDDADCIELLGVKICKVDEAVCVSHVLRSLANGIGGWIITYNVDIMRRHFFDHDFRRLALHASMIVADGMPLVWASRIQGTPLPSRVAGSNLINALSASAADHGRSIFLLGGDLGTAEQAAGALVSRWPNVRIAGTWFPPPGFESNAAEIEKIRLALVRAQPSIVYVALGSPKQEKLIMKLRSVLPQSWWVGVGISFSFLSGTVRRAPEWMQRSGLEWMHRLWQEPRRLGRRYLKDGIPFAAFLLWTSIRKRFAIQRVNSAKEQP
jgi:N-acetylglucosaminyldiphosphoundecaprenol N-acetyl-beta-D-mannosaminyltransferase